MIAFKPLITSVLTRNVVRSGPLHMKNLNLLRQYATKIAEPKKKSSTMKLLLFGVRKKSFSLNLPNLEF